MGRTSRQRQQTHKDFARRWSALVVAQRASMASSGVDRSIVFCAHGNGRHTGAHRGESEWRELTGRGTGVRGYGGRKAVVGSHTVAVAGSGTESCWLEHVGQGHRTSAPSSVIIFMWERTSCWVRRGTRRTHAWL